MKEHLSTLSDEEIFLLVKQENKDAFAEIYRRYWKELVDAAYKRVKSAEKATEIVQQLFVTIYTKRETITFTSSLRNYLHVALRNRVLNDVRNSLVHSSYQQHILSSPAASQPDAAAQLQLKELQQLIDRAYAMLPEKCRAVFLLSRQEHLSYQRIAHELGISVNTVEKHMAKALRILRAGLKEYTPGIIWLIACTLL
jgi:RNA polymerase sigma-70 factor (family 1)